MKLFYYELEGWQSLNSALRGLGIVLININSYENLKTKRYKGKKAFSGILGNGTEVAVQWNRSIANVRFYDVTDPQIELIKQNFRKEIDFIEKREGKDVVLYFDIQAFSKCIDSIPLTL